ncbi:MAG TPA: tRNA glutamyl-Q(34) synthetase GluQRS [Tepidisphaeraceae bacterium]|nr:tRNA glutamyl-Q(34) synthetase GluQRS [Tepidisphaeraceae bacterium]
MSTQPAITRLAPSPTGALHLGNARTFLVNWLLARQQDWRIVLRIEDLDGPRLKVGADRQLIDDLQWLGIDWDDGPTYQSTRLASYQAAAERLMAQRDAYACICTRKEIETAASAPHAEDGATVYPGTCRGRFTDLATARAATTHGVAAVRFAVPAAPIAFDDAFAGPQRWANVAQQLGDFVILKGDGLAAYQLAVVIDDAEAGVTEVVRGDDLIDSSPRQILLYRALGLAERIPRYTHLPLIVGPDSRRLAKRHGDTRLATYRAIDPSPQRALRLLARWCGIDDTSDVRTARDLVGRLDLTRFSKDAITFTAADDRFLRSGKT